MAARLRASVPALSRAGLVWALPPGAPAVSSGGGRGGGPLGVQRRWWHDPDATRKDKPVVTGCKYAFVRQHVPVVLLQPVRGLGKQGQIVNVKRGYARHQLVPKGLAVFGTWENIDAYADPALVEDPALRARAASERGRLPFDWVDEVCLAFVRWSREDQPAQLLEPLTVWELLEALSNDHELDLLPGSLDLPEAGIVQLGRHEVPVRIPFRNPESAAGRYTILVHVASVQSQLDERRKEEMAKAVQESIRFQLPQRGGAVEVSEEFDDSDDDEGGPDAGL